LNWENGPAVLEQSLAVVDRDPQLALSLTDSALRDIRSGRMNDRFAVPVLLVRQQAFSRLGMLDSVLAVGVDIRQRASLTRDSMAMAKSLLPVRGEISMADQQAIEPFLPGAVRSFKSAGLKYEEAVIEGLIGGIGTRKGDFTGSMGHLYRARDILEGLDSIRPLYAIYMNIGNNRSGMRDYRASIGFYEMAGGVARRMGDSIRMASAMMNEGIALSSLKRFDSSRLRLNDALRMLPTKNGALAKLQILFNLATISEQQGLLSDAEADYRRVLDGARAMGDPVAIGMANGGLAMVLGQTGRVGIAIRMLEENVRLFDTIGLRHYSIDLSGKLVALYKTAGRYPDALAASEHRKLLMDSLISEENRNSVQELEVKYQTALKATENLKLKQEVRTRNLVAVGLLLIVASLLALILVLRQRNRYHRALIGTYERLVADYRRQRDEALKPGSHVIVNNPEDGASESHVSSENGKSDDVEASEPSTSAEDLALFHRMMDILETQKPHLSPGFGAEDLAQSLGVSARKLPQITRMASSQTFTQFINRLRIDEATRLMEDPAAGSMKIDTIAGKCGFSNRQHFRRVFEQVTGVTPGYFKRKTEDPSSE